MTEEGKVSLEIKDKIAWVSFEHPKSNSLPGSLLEQIANEIDSANRDKTSTVIVLQSAGERTFCAGASFDELCAVTSPLKGKEFFLGFAKVILAIRNARKFVVGRIQGKTVGGGVGIAAACDYAVAHESAAVKLSELALGLGPFVIGPAVQRKIGRTHFMNLTIDADWRSAEWAERAGLYAKVVKDHQELDQAVTDLATRLSNFNPDAMLALKQMFWKGTDHWVSLLTARAETSGGLVLSDYTQSAIESFKNKK